MTGDEQQARPSASGKTKPNISSNFTLFSVELIQAVQQYKFWSEVYCTDILPSQ